MKKEMRNKMHLKGILVSLLGVVMCVLSLMLIAVNANPFVVLALFIGFMLIFAGPFYFWYLEPILALQKSEK